MLIYTFIFYFARLLIDVGRNNRSDHRIDMDDKQISDNCKKVSKKCGTIRFSISWREISLSKIGNMKQKKEEKKES